MNKNRFLDALERLIAFTRNLNGDFELNQSLNVLIIGCSKEEVKALARQFGSSTKVYGEFNLWIEKHFGEGVKLSIMTERELFCRQVEKVVVVPAQPAQEEIPEHTTIVKEWVCDEPLLGE